MYFPPVYKRLHYIDCNQLFRYVFRQASTSPFFCTFSKKGTKGAVFKKNQHIIQAIGTYIPCRRLKPTVGRKKYILFSRG